MKQLFNLRQIIYFSVGLTGIAFIAALQIKLNIGIGPWDGFGRSISYITGLKVGDIAMMQSIGCVLITFMLLKKDFKIRNVLTLVVGVILGSLMNFFFYTVLDKIVINSYIIKLFIFVISIVISAFFVSMVQTSEFVSLPLENLCQVIADRNGKTFAFIRQAVDVLCVIGIIVITIFFRVPLTLREGTILSMIIFSPFTGVFMPKLSAWLIKEGILSDRTQTHSPVTE